MSKPPRMKCRVVRNEADEPVRVDVYDDIGDFGWFGGISASDFAAQVAGIKGALSIHINSGGGDVADGTAIANAIRNHPGHTKTVVDGMAASIASVILQAGKERVTEPGSLVMIHEPSSYCVGDARDMAKEAEILDKVGGVLAAAYCDRSGTGTPESWRDAMREETWYTAEEAVEAGLADKVGAGTAELPPGLDVTAFTSAPGRIAARLRTMPVAKLPARAGHSAHPNPGDNRHPADDRPAAGDDRTLAAGEPAPPYAAPDRPKAGEQSCEALGHQCCKDAASAKDLLAGLVRAEVGARLSAAQGKPGTHGDHDRVDPDGDGDCDACPEGDTDGDYWSEDGEQIQSLPDEEEGDEDGVMTDAQVRAIVREELSVIRDDESDFDNSDWDASKAWHNGAESGDPAAFYAGICAGRKAGDKSTQDAWALPYKYTPSSKPNANGVRNALSRLPQTEGLTNAGEAKALLERLMKKLNPDYEPEDHAPAEYSDDDFEQFRTALRGASA